MWANNTIICLDLSSNELNDHSGSYIARILKRNFTLKKLELCNNNFGSRTCAAFGESLVNNNSLVYLSLDSNPLVDDNINDVSGIKLMADALRVNKTLTSLNLWRCKIPEQGGIAIANAIEENNSLLFLELGKNTINTSEIKRVADKLDLNLGAFETYERARRINVATEEKELQKIQEKEKKAENEAEMKVWLANRRALRAEERRSKHETRIIEAQIEAEARAKAELEAKKAAAAKEAEEAAKKAAKKKKG